MHRFPSVEWTEAFKNALNHSKAYREAGKPWVFGAVAMVVKGDPCRGIAHDVGMIVDVHEGTCRSAKFIERVRDLADANFVIAASYPRWKDVIEGKLDPIKGMMQGKLKLTKGELSVLVRFVESSRQLVASAREVPTEFPH